MFSAFELSLPNRELIFKLEDFDLVAEAIIHYSFFKLLQVSAYLSHEECSDLLLG